MNLIEEVDFYKNKKSIADTAQEVQPTQLKNNFVSNSLAAQQFEIDQIQTKFEFDQDRYFKN